MEAYQKTVGAILEDMQVNSQTGLTDQEVEQRRRKYGWNKLPEIKPESWFIIFLRQFQSPLIYVLFGAAFIIFFTSEKKFDVLVIAVVILFNAVLGMIQEGRTRKILSSLKRFIKTEAVVIRHGKKQLIPAEQLVVGDIIDLQEGNKVPADARIIENSNLKTEEAVLTGESEPIVKTVDPIAQAAALGDRFNMVYKGTLIVAGSGKAVVTAIGSRTEIGKIQTATHHIHTDVPLVREVHRLSYAIVLIVSLSCLILFIIGLLEGREFRELLLIMSALFVSVIPEGLPIVVTLVLVTGMYRLAQKNVLIKKMHAVEGLGRTQVIAIDKTGTLTRNEMMVCFICAGHARWKVTGQGYFPEGQIVLQTKKEGDEQNRILHQIGIASFFLSSAELFYDEKLNIFEVKGDPTEAALSVLAQKLQISRKNLEQQYKKLYEIPFDSQLRYRAVFYEKDSHLELFISGAPEEIVRRCRPFENSTQQCLDDLLHGGLRLVALAHKEIPLEQVGDIPEGKDADQFFKELIKDCTFLAFLGLEDAIRSEVADIIEKTRDVGIKVIMITGDHKKTAAYVAKKVGILHEDDQILEGADFEKMSEQERLANLGRTTVYARFSPEDKYEVVKLFHKKGAIIAMTGDGINDVPSLIAADLGIAMGSIGTEVTKEAADIVLLDDSFVNIVNAIEEGRHIFYTLRRVILYLFSTNAAEVMIIFLSLLFNVSLPLSAVQIIWLNLVTDGFLDIGIAMEPKEQGLLEQEHWLKGTPRLVDYSFFMVVFFMALPMAVISFAVFLYYSKNIPLARTMTLITLALFQWINAWNCRSLNKSVFSLSIFANKWFLAATVLITILQLSVLYVPFMRYLFGTVALTGEQWLIAIILSSFLLVWVECGKYLYKRWSKAH